MRAVGISLVEVYCERARGRTSGQPASPSSSGTRTRLREACARGRERNKEYAKETRVIYG